MLCIVPEGGCTRIPIYIYIYIFHGNIIYIMYVHWVLSFVFCNPMTLTI